MPSVVVLTRRQPAAYYLLNRLQERFPLQRVFFESWDRPRAELSARTVQGARLQLLKRARYYRARAEELLSGEAELVEAAHEQVFERRWRRLEQAPPVFELEDKAWGVCAAELAKERPEVILVLGTSLIPETVTAQARVAALNIHTGLSPYYRGANCTPFAILNEDLESIGTTVHIVRRQIDGGEIIRQARPRIVSGDDEFSLDAKTLRLGIEDYLEILGRLERGQVLRPAPQPTGSGLLLMFRAYTAGHAALVRRLVREGAVERYLERKALGRSQPLKAIVSELQMG